MWCVVDVFLPARSDGKAATHLFNCLLKMHNGEPTKKRTDELGNYGVTRCGLLLSAFQHTFRNANNRAELLHQPTRVRERDMRRFKSAHQAQRFFSAHAAVYNLFNLGRRLISAKHYR